MHSQPYYHVSGGPNRPTKVTLQTLIIIHTHETTALQNKHSGHCKATKMVTEEQHLENKYKGTKDPEGSAHNSCNSWPLYACSADQRACFG